MLLLVGVEGIISIVIIVVIAVAIFILFGFRLDREYQRSVIFRLGKYSRIKGPGFYWIMPIIDIRKQLDIRIRTLDIARQETVTKDSVTIKIDAVLYFKVADPYKAVCLVKNYEHAAVQYALTTLRNVVGQHNLDSVLNERVSINKSILDIVDVITDEWGLKVSAIEIKDVEIPKDMQRAMAKEAEATREKRSRIIKAEGEEIAAVKLGLAAQEMKKNPMALELRRMQMVSEVGVEHNTTTIIMMPSEFMHAAESISKNLINK